MANHTTADIEWSDLGDAKRCPQCGEMKPLTEFYRNAARLDGVAPYCITCNRRRNDEQVRRDRAELLRFLGGRCRRCGFDNPLALQVDHVNGGGSAERRRSRASSRTMLSRARENPDLYQLLCANCNIIKRFECGEHVGAREYVRLAIKERPKPPGVVTLWS